jgi:TolB-like protein/Flp pilus assembly protein TadD
MSAKTSFIAELQRRKVFKVGAAYLVVAWLAVQAASIGFPAFDAPPWALRVFILIALLGFPVVLVLTWVIDMTPEGVKLDPNVSGNKRVYAGAVLLVVLALGWYFYGQPSFRKGDATPPKEATAVAVVVAPAIAQKSIAVLPFENLSDNKANEYFVSGMQDMILTSLSQFSDLKVISRTSTEKYASRPENLKQVAAELGVAHILEGSVQRDGDQVLINLQLIDAASDTHLWAQSFDRKVENVFSVEREVAGLVADALRTTLLPAARAGLGTAPTRNQAAYDVFLRAEFEARKYISSNDGTFLRQAVGHYEQAVAADPSFALAFAHLSQARFLQYWDSLVEADKRGALADAALDAAQTAKRLAPDLPDADLALADYQYRIKLDYPGALASYEEVLARQPRNQTALIRRAFTLRRLGRFDAAIESLSAAMDVDPRDSFPCMDRGVTRFLAGHLDLAEADFRRALSLNPEDDLSAGFLSDLLLYRDGDAGKALAVLREGSTFGAQKRVGFLVFQRHFDQALALVNATLPTGDTDLASRFARAEILFLTGRSAEARADAQALVADLRREVAALPDNSGAGQNSRIRLAEVEAILGNERAALEQVSQALARLSPEIDPANGAINLGQSARIYGLLGRTDLLLPLLAQIRALNGTDLLTSAANLRLDPVWDRVRKDPAFQAEIVRFTDRETTLR